MVLRIRRHHDISKALGAPGLLLPILGFVLGSPVLSAIGTVLLMASLVYQTKAKGHHPAWCLLGLLSGVGVVHPPAGVVLAFGAMGAISGLPDRLRYGRLPASLPPVVRPVEMTPADPGAASSQAL